MIRISSTTDALFSKFAFLYLTLPYIIFSLGWLRIPNAILVTVTLIFSLYLVNKHIRNDHNKNIGIINVKNISLWFSLIILLFWLLFSGTGHFSDQLFDYKKHNLILTQLINQDWPVIQHTTSSNAYVLIYYLGYYLPAGLVGKIIGNQAANIFQFVYSLVGIFIGFYFIFRSTGSKYPFFITCIFIIFGGMDIWGRLIKFREYTPMGLIDEWWSELFIYQGNTEILYWAPQQVIPTWIIVSMLMYFVFKGFGRKYFVFLWSLSIFWSPWIFLGLIPIISFMLYQSRDDLDSLVSFENIIASILIISISVTFFSINQNSINNNGWIWSFGSPWVERYLVFIFVEFLSLGILLLFVLRGNYSPYKKILLLSLLVLVAIPLYRGGIFNDFCMRVSIPSLTILAIITIHCLVMWMEQCQKLKSCSRRFLHLIILLLLLLGSINAFDRILLAVSRTFSINSSLFYPYDIEFEDNLFYAFNSRGNDLIPEQYLARNVNYKKYQWLFRF